MSDANLTWHPHSISRKEREEQNGHRGCVIWFTGLSGSGKSTVANLVDQMLHSLRVHSYVLDGDNIRHGLCAPPELLAERYGATLAERFGLKFSAEDRTENIRRIGAVAGLFCDAGVATLTAFVSPFRADRDAVRASLSPGDFVEVYVQAPLDLCEARDPKGLYKEARAGRIPMFTGIDSPYEPPVSPEVVLDSAASPADVLAAEVIAFLRSTGRIP
jgi:adenylylsulfate kinase